MAAPTVTLRMNTGTEGVPVWTEVTAANYVYFAGPATTAGSLDSITRPGAGTVFPDELWKGDGPGYGSGVQCTTYEQDITTAVNTNVLAVQFDANPTSTAPSITCWDDNTHLTTAKEALAGTAGTPDCLVRGVITASDVLPAAGAGTLPAGWGTQTTATDTYKMEGSTFYQTAASAITAGNQVRFVMTTYIPSDSQSSSTGHDPVITVEYTYT